LKVGTIYCYLAVVLDINSRQVLGWAYGKRKDVALISIGGGTVNCCWL
jgi:hypothetical protein